MIQYVAQRMMEMDILGERLRAAEMPMKLRHVLLGDRNENITSHYSMPRIGELLEAAERVVEVKDSPSVVRLIGGVAVQGPPRDPQKKPKAP